MSQSQAAICQRRDSWLFQAVAALPLRKHPHYIKWWECPCGRLECCSLTGFKAMLLVTQLCWEELEQPQPCAIHHSEWPASNWTEELLWGSQSCLMGEDGCVGKTNKSSHAWGGQGEDHWLTGKEPQVWFFTLEGDQLGLIFSQLQTSVANLEWENDGRSG